MRLPTKFNASESLACIALQVFCTMFDNQISNLTPCYTATSHVSKGKNMIHRNYFCLSNSSCCGTGEEKYSSSNQDLAEYRLLPSPKQNLQK